MHPPNKFTSILDARIHTQLPSSTQLLDDQFGDLQPCCTESRRALDRIASRNSIHGGIIRRCGNHPLVIVLILLADAKNLSPCRGLANSIGFFRGPRHPEFLIPCHLPRRRTLLMATCSGISTVCSRFTTWYSPPFPSASRPLCTSP